MPIDVHPIAGIVGLIICVVLVGAWVLEQRARRRYEKTGKPSFWYDGDDPDPWG